MSEVPALVAEATKKSGLIWVTVGDRPATAAWHLWQDDAAYVVTGPGEQPVPGLAEADRCQVTVRSTDKGGRIVTWAATVRRVRPGSAEWAAVTPALLAKRLNQPDGETAAQRWAQECAVCRLEPTGELVEAGVSLRASSHAAPPRPTPATSRVRVPYTLRRRPR